MKTKTAIKVIESIMNPKCRTERGYDTHVRIHPDEFYTVGKPETHRTVTVTCTYHNQSVTKTFATRNLAKIQPEQDAAFKHCFKVLEQICRDKLELEQMEVN